MEQFPVFTGRVISGHHLGRRLGFPTANIVVTAGESVPPFGVYAAWVTLPDGSRHAAVTNLGVRPTVEQSGALWVASYLLDFSGDLYGENVKLSLVDFIRPEVKFDSIEELKEQIEKDVKKALDILRDND